MEIGVENLKAIFRHTMQHFKAFDTELSAYRTVFHALKLFYGPEAQLDEALKLVQESEQLRQQMYQKYDATLEKALAQIDQAAHREEEIAELFRNWKPDGPAN